MAQIPAGEAIVRIGADLNPLQRGLNAAQASLTKFGVTATQIGAGLTAAGLAIAGPIVKAAQEFAKAGDDVAKMSRRTGIAVDALSTLGYAAELSGSNLAEVEVSVRRMQRSIVDAGEGLKTATDFFDALGLSVTEVSALSPEDQFRKIATAISTVDDPTKRAAYAMEVFGRSGSKLLPLISDLNGGFENTKREAKLLGVTLDTETAAKAEALSDQFTRIQKAALGFAITVGSAVAPTIIGYGKALVDVAVRVKDYLAANEELIVNVLKIGAAVTAAGLAIAGIGASALGAAAVVKFLGVAFGATTALLTPFVLALGVAAGALAIFGEDALGEFGSVAAAFRDMIADIRVDGTSLGAWAATLFKTIGFYAETAAQLGAIAWESLKLSASASLAYVAEYAGKIAIGINKIFWDSVSTITNAFKTLAESVLKIGKTFDIIDQAEYGRAINSIVTLRNGVRDFAEAQKDAARETFGYNADEQLAKAEASILRLSNMRKALSEDYFAREKALNEENAETYGRDYKKAMEARPGLVDRLGGIVDENVAKARNEINNAKASLEEIGRVGQKQQEESVKAIASREDIFGAFSARAISGQATTLATDKRQEDLLSKIVSNTAPIKDLELGVGD